MDAQAWGNIIQVVAVLVALSLGVAAQVMARKDRIAADLRADDDRREAARVAEEQRRHDRSVAHDTATAADKRSHTQNVELSREADLRFRLTALQLLVQNLSKPGSTDSEESKRLAAERVALIHVIGPDDLPRTWARWRKDSLDDARRMLEDEETSPEKASELEAILLLDETARKYRALGNRPTWSGGLSTLIL